MHNALGIRCLKLAVLYALVAIGIGIAMAASHDFAQKTLHAHTNLAGWVSLAVMGLAYIALPALTRSWLATAHFWLHNTGVPIMLVGVYFIHAGQMETGEPFAKIGSTITALAFLCFALNVWRNAGAAARD
ncbi:MAG TPA: hypothetical protein VN028_06030 [Rhodocyclaceae bacterium]|nr:hypothetical protein [Rhodocyclaceae bacterium]